MSNVWRPKIVEPDLFWFTSGFSVLLAIPPELQLQPARWNIFIYWRRTNMFTLPQSQRDHFLGYGSMAGEEGFEPPSGASRGHCLTTWRLPNTIKAHRDCTQTNLNLQARFLNMIKNNLLYVADALRNLVFQAPHLVIKKIGILHFTLGTLHSACEFLLGEFAALGDTG